MMEFPAEKPLLFGHRGYSSLRAENTIASFQLCVEKQIPGVELDVQLCKTGELVVIHDANVLRVSGRDALVADLSFEELRGLDVGGHEQIPLLSELFELCADKLYYDIELKVPDLKDRGLELKTWQTISAFGLQKRCMVSSFNPFAVRRFNRISNFALQSAVIFDDSPSIPRPFRHGWGRHIARCSYLKPSVTLLDEEMVTRFRKRKGYPLIVWTVDDYESAKRALELGAEGFVSNNPEPLLSLLG